jgi:hypothetical protein
MTVCRIEEVGVEVDLESSAQIGWIIGRVWIAATMTPWWSEEEAAITAIKSAEKRRKQEELIASLIADNPDLAHLQSVRPGCGVPGARRRGIVMQSAVLLCLTIPGKRRQQGLRMRAAHSAPYGRAMGRAGEPKEASGEGFPGDTRSPVRRRWLVAPNAEKPRVRKPQGGLRACRRCGTLPTSFGLMRNGDPKPSAQGIHE